MKKWIFLLALCAAGQYATVYGQTADSTQRRAWAAIAQPGSSPRWLKVRDDVKLTPRNFFEKSRIALGLTSRDVFRLQKSETDELGMVHHRFQQYHKGEDATYLLHELDGRISTANGRLATGADLLEPPITVSEQKALAAALELVPSRHYLWLDKSAEANLQKREDNPKATFYPTGELVWLQPAEQAAAGRHRWAQYICLLGIQTFQVSKPGRSRSKNVQ